MRASKKATSGKFGKLLAFLKKKNVALKQWFTVCFLELFGERCVYTLFPNLQTIADLVKFPILLIVDLDFVTSGV